ncbi:hypothetical protein TorRG33x02_007680 [Trema orientale]|uniref:Uncharacterized protein n=1 Tax=Trema orientale TaxID=63057 RepID=A0A2P5G0I3_TREOI|nr:hypothetical protein TorRG33x02_007680 [Trema orientale]
MVKKILNSLTITNASASHDVVSQHPCITPLVLSRTTSSSRRRWRTGGHSASGLGY